jgi:hypothetical protein
LRKGTEKRHSHQVDEAVFKRESLHTKSQSQENVTLTSGTYKKHKAKLVNAINHYRLPQEDSLSKKKGKSQSFFNFSGTCPPGMLQSQDLQQSLNQTSIRHQQQMTTELLQSTQ